MRPTRLLALAAGTVLLGTACGGDDGNGPSNANPTADFTAPACTVNVPCDFAGTGSDSDGTIASYSWNFGDGSAATTGQTATHTYTAANTYQVTLTVTDNAGGTGTATKSVTVSAPAQGPTASFTVSCTNLDCTFTDTSTDPSAALSSWAWDFGDGQTSTEQSPTHTYPSTGNYTVSLTVTDANGATNTATQTVTVTAPPASQCVNNASGQVECTLDISQRSSLTVTMTNRACELGGNRFEIRSPIRQIVFFNGCSEPLGTVYTINNGTPFEAGTQLVVRFTQGVGAPTDPTPGQPAIRVDGTYPTWTLNIDDGGTPNNPGEPDYNDIVLTVQATQQ